MNRYLIQDTQSNNDYAKELVNKTLEGTLMGEYIQVYHNKTKYMFLATELKQIKESINKTAVINSLRYIDKSYKNIDEIKDIIRYKTLLIKRTKADIESIEYAYNEIVEIYVLSCKGILHWYAQSFLKDAIKEILKSSIEINSYNKQYLDYLIENNLL